MSSPKASCELPKIRRLRSPADYREIYGGSYWGNTASFSFNVVPADNRALGVTVSKKVSNSAVQRNLIKRQIKEYYRLHQDQLPNTKIVITAKPAAASLTRNARRDDLGELWQKALKWHRWYERKGQQKSAAPQ